MCDDVEYIIERLSEQSGVNSCIVSYKEKCCKIARENYYPDKDGILTLKAEREWNYSGFSVAELLELLKTYQNSITDILFETYEGEIKRLLNIFEVDNIGVIGEFDCLLMVGEKGEVLKLYNNPDNSNYMRDVLGYMH